MITFLLGFCGGLLALAAVGAGTLLGWQLQRLVRPRTGPRTGEDRRRREEQQAFRQLQNYSAERAYGMVDDLGGEAE